MLLWLYICSILFRCTAEEPFFSGQPLGEGGSETGKPDAGGGDTGNDNQSGYNPDKSWFDNVITFLISIPSKIQDVFVIIRDSLLTSVVNMATNLGQFAKDVGAGFENISSWLVNLGSNIGGFIAELGSNIGGFFGNLVSNLQSFFNNLVQNIQQGFAGIADTILHLFIPTDEQKEAHIQQELAMQETIRSKIPFVPYFQDEIQKAFSYQESTDFLHLRFEGWDMNLGIIKIHTPDVDFTKVRDAYEPYRIYVRGFLLLIVYGMAGVYIVKFILNYGATDAVNVAVRGGKE